MRGRTIRFTTKRPGMYSQLFGDIFTKLTQIAAAVRTRLARGQHLIYPVKMIGQRFAAVFTLGGLIWGIAVRRVILLLRLSGRFNLFVFRQIEGELIKGLGLGAEAGFFDAPPVAL